MSVIDRDDEDLVAHHPDLKEVPKDKGLFCFQDDARMCGPDCMAWQNPPEGPDYVAQQWAHCMLLTNLHKLGKGSQIIANELVRKNRDDARNQAQPPRKP